MFDVPNSNIALAMNITRGKVLMVYAALSALRSPASRRATKSSTLTARPFYLCHGKSIAPLPPLSKSK
jgi:hypothetical protein